MTGWRWGWAAALVTAALQSTAPAVQIEFPPAGSYVSGVVTLRAAVVPADLAVRRMEFFADGERVCARDEAPFTCDWDAGDSVREHHIRVVVELPDERRLVQSIRTAAVGYAENVDVESVLVPVLVTDGDRFIQGLSREAFRVFEDGRPQQISHFSAENVPLDAVVAIDISGSMAPVLSRVKLAVRRFFEALRPVDRVTLLAFNENVFTLTRGDSTVEIRMRALDRLAPWGGTALYDVLIRGMSMLGRATGRRALVVFSDGYDRSSRSSLDAAKRAVEAGDAVVYLVVLGQSEEVRRSRKIVEALADGSGGRAFFRNKVDDLDRDFTVIVEELSNQYLLAYTSDRPRGDEAWRKLKVELTGERYRVRARQGYRAVSRSDVK